MVHDAFCELHRRKCAVMKGFFEERGVQCQILFDASSGTFSTYPVVHDFENNGRTLEDAAPAHSVVKLRPRAQQPDKTARTSVDSGTKFSRFRAERRG